MKILKRILVGIVLLVFACCLGADLYVDTSYFGGMPASPEPSTGRIYRIEVNHGFVRYVTSEEFERANFIRHTLFPFGIGFGALGVGLAVRWKALR